MAYHLPERKTQKDGTVLVLALANGGVWEPEPTPALQEVGWLGSLPALVAGHSHI